MNSFAKSIHIYNTKEWNYFPFCSWRKCVTTRKWVQMIIKVKEFSSENIFCTRLMIVKLSVPVINTRVLRYVQLQWMCVESVCTPSLVTFSCYCYHRKTSNKHMLVNAKCYFLSVFFFLPETLCYFSFTEWPSEHDNVWFGLWRWSIRVVQCNAHSW